MHKLAVRSWEGVGRFRHRLLWTLCLLQWLRQDFEDFVHVRLQGFTIALVFTNSGSASNFQHWILELDVAYCLEAGTKCA